ncbi:hypothetical protein FRX31_029119 [Thalictrum thalictroides]|uniref:Uncharacterized protein n=1 Tax=Thalictrum thalictroides TaxID=46969 RepID=A0A7J6V8K7_THATH|nr:hypothetical protein FRX31_029119 [Thalictrum thalictroides]
MRFTADLLVMKGIWTCMNSSLVFFKLHPRIIPSNVTNHIWTCNNINWSGTVKQSFSCVPSHDTLVAAVKRK